MKNITALNDVAKFHSTFGHPIEKSPVIPSLKRCNLRISLIREELDELEKAISNNDLVEVSDALCDLQYVLAGAILEFGLGEKFHSLFKEVQRSNMSKACNSIQDAEATVKFYTEKENVECEIKMVTDKYLIYRKPDGKVLKSIYYSPANLKSIIK